MLHNKPHTMKLLIRLIFPVFFFVFFLFAVPMHEVRAQGTASVQTGAQNYVDQGIADECYKARTIKALNQCGMGFRIDNVSMAKKIEDILGAVPGITAVANDPEYNKKITASSAVGGTTRFIAMMFESPPASTYAFIQDMGQTLGFIPKTAYAQGVGFSGLTPLLGIWKAFRNIAYLLMAVFMVIIGFMIMFRKKIDPKIVVTVQNALPRVVIALLLITFSYAIVGLFIDLMYLLIVMAVQIFKSSLPDLDTAQFLSKGLMSNVYTLNPTSVFGRVVFGTNMDTTLFNNLWMGSIGVVAAAVAIAGWAPGALAIMALGTTPMLLGLIIAIAQLFLVIRLFIFFFKAYINILMSLLFGPFQLLISAIPGSKAAESWLKNLASNIIVFPIGAVMFLLSGVFINIANQGSGNIWSPPYTQLFVFNATSLGTLVAMGILFAIPTVATSVQELFKVKPFMQAGPEGAVGVLGQPLGTAVQVGQFLWNERSMRLMRQSQSDMAKAMGAAKGPEEKR